MPVVVLSGLRQTGKSTLLLRESDFQKRIYYTFDDFRILDAARHKTEELLDASQSITLDEVQKCPEILNTIKFFVDQKRSKGRFLLSGSANLALLEKVSESLAGRAIYLTLYPMTRREISKQTDLTPFVVEMFDKKTIPYGKIADALSFKEILLGGLPPVCLHAEENNRIWFKGYEQTYLERDVRQISNITDAVSFHALMQLTALRTGQILKASELARDAKMNVATTLRHLHLMEATFMIRRIPPFLKNRSSRLIKSPKIYFTDSGIAAFLAEVEEKGDRSQDMLRGALLETYVLQNLSAILEAHLPEARIYFWNEQGRYEVDFVIEHKRNVIALEIKNATRWSKNDLAGLEAFISRTPQCNMGILAYNGDKILPIDNKIWAVPIGILLS
ncbi:MAG: ATP-binding protein [Verrucomicrobiota bacterium]